MGSCCTRGVADHFAENEDEALAKVRSIVEHFGPRLNRCGFARILPVDEPLFDREDILGLIPEDNKHPLDVRCEITKNS